MCYGIHKIHEKTYGFYKTITKHNGVTIVIVKTIYIQNLLHLGQFGFLLDVRSCSNVMHRISCKWSADIKHLLTMSVKENHLPSTLLLHMTILLILSCLD